MHPFSFLAKDADGAARRARRVYFGCSTQSLIRAFPGATQLDTPPVVDMDQ